MIDYKSHKAIYELFIMSNFNYFPIVCMFTSKRSLDNVKKIKKLALCFVPKDYQSNFRYLLSKSEVTGINSLRPSDAYMRQ